jgi:succinate dehydrogenase/fumarate reductase flavoprotein subunit
MAAGEIVGGLHGANRLAGHALSETVVFGRRAGSTAAQWASGQRASAQRASGRSLEKEKLDSFQPELPVPGGDDSESLLTELKTTMWNKVGLVRSEKGLKESLDEVESLNQRLIDQRPKSLRSWLTVSHALTAARLVIRAALLRKESRGAHFREDFPQTNDEFQGNYIQRKNNIDFIPAKVL